MPEPSYSDGNNVVFINDWAPSGSSGTSVSVKVESDDDILKSGGGGGTSGGMETRVAKLESDVSHIKDTLKALDNRVEKVRDDVGSIKISLATLSEKVSQLPGKGFVVTATSTSIALLAGLIIFGDRLKTAVGL